MVMGELELSTELLVLGSGPGGYAAAFRAADLGLDVALVDPLPRPGGVGLAGGCISSKTLLFLAELRHDAKRAAEMGVHFGTPHLDLEQLRADRDRVVDSLAAGLTALGNSRGVQVIRGRAVFESSTSVRLTDSEVRRIIFRHAVIATGSRPRCLAGTQFRPGGRIISPLETLQLDAVPGTLLVIGAGPLAVELGSAYAALGSSVTLITTEDRLLPGVDRDLVEPLQRRLSRTFDAISLGATIGSLSETGAGVEIAWEQEGAPATGTFDRALVAIGWEPNSRDLGLEHTDVALDADGFIVVDEGQRTGDRHILAAGDVTGGARLAHQAIRQGRVAAEVVSGLPAAVDIRALPAVVHTDPQIAWCGLTETEAAADSGVTIHRFPWKFSNRAAILGAADGLTKLLVDSGTGRLLGVGICGRNAGELIAEGVLAIEMGAQAEDLALCLHPHPSLSETLGEAAELSLGGATHLPPLQPGKQIPE